MLCLWDMNSTLVLLLACSIVFGALPLILRSNGALVLFTLCVGQILAGLIGGDLTNGIGSKVTSPLPIFTIVQIVLLVLPALLVMFIYRRAAKADILLHIFTYAVAVIVCFSAISTFLPYAAQSSVQDSNVYHQIHGYVGIVLSAGIIVSLVILWLKKPHHDKKQGKKHRSK